MIENISNENKEIFSIACVFYSWFYVENHGFDFTNEIAINKFMISQNKYVLISELLHFELIFLLRILKQSQFSMPNIFNEILSIYCFGNISVTLIFDLLFVQSAINFCAPTLLRVENGKKIKRIEKQYRI